MGNKPLATWFVPLYVCLQRTRREIRDFLIARLRQAEAGHSSAQSKHRRASFSRSCSFQRHALANREYFTAVIVWVPLGDLRELYRLNRGFSIYHFLFSPQKRYLYHCKTMSKSAETPGRLEELWRSIHQPAARSTSTAFVNEVARASTRYNRLRKLRIQG